MNHIATTTRVTVPFEAKDLISGALRSIRVALRDTTDDFIDFRRASGQMSDEFATGSRRATRAAEELGSRINDATDEVRALGRQEVRDVFTGARQGANEFRRTVNRAEAEVRGMSDARVHLRARDEVSPVLDGISSKIAGIVAAAGGVVIGGGLKDAVFGGVMDYYTEASRSAAFLPSNVRQQGLSTVDNLYQQGLFSSRVEGAKQLAEVAPLSKDKHKASDFLTESAKIQYIRPDAGTEEINRALSQSSDTFKESYAQVADSMMYAYKEVGDRQQDLFDTFWEYSGYFKKTGASSAQMSNFLVKSVQDGSFNFDKPADFFKEVFGVKALDAGDMTNYFALRGAGKNEAQRQAAAFTNDINSGDEQRVKGALMALVGDLTSQNPNELKQSLVTLGSATAEDNGDSVLKNFKTAFEKAPDGVKGTTDRLVNAQREANPMQDTIETRRQIDLQMQEIGANITSAALPAMQQFNQLLTENKEGIQALGKGIADFITSATKFYTEHFELVNGAIAVLGGGYLTKKIWDVSKGPVSVGKKIWEWGRGKLGGKLPGENADLVSSLMTVHATNVVINGQSRSGGGLDLDDDGQRRGRRVQKSKKGRGRNVFTRNPVSNTLDKLESAVPKKKGNVWNRIKNNKLFSGASKEVAEASKFSKGASNLLKSGGKLIKGAGIIGTAASVGMGAYDLYQAAKEKGVREAVSTKGGAMVGSVGGGIIGGAIGSLAGPIGTAAGAAIGSWAGERLGALADSSGLTRKVVDKTVELKDSVVSWSKDTAASIKESFGSMKEWFTGKKADPVKPLPPPEAKVSFDGMSPKNQEKMQAMFNEFSKTVADKGLGEAVKGAINQPAIKQTVESFKTVFKDVWKGTKSTQAEQNIHAVGTAASKTADDAKKMGQTVKGSTDKIAQGAGEASRSFTGISSSAKNAAEQTRQHLMSLQNISSQGSSWGSNLISMMTAGIRSRFPSLTSAVSEAAGVIKKFLGFHSPTEEGPASDSNLWAGNFVSMFASGLKAEPIRERMSLIAGTMKRGVQELQGPSLNSSIPIAGSLTQSPLSSPHSVTIQSMSFDFGELAKGVTDFAEFAQMMSSSQGRSLIRKVFGEELYKVLEMGG